MYGAVPGTTAESASGNLPTELAMSHELPAGMSPSPCPPSIFTEITAPGTTSPFASTARSTSCTESPAVISRVAGITSMRLTGDGGSGAAGACWKRNATTGSTTWNDIRGLRAWVRVF